MTYVLMALPAHHNARAQLVDELVRETLRRLPRPLGVEPIPVLGWLFREAGYCLDAPDAIPAGGCESDEFEDGHPAPMQMLVRR